MVSDSRELDDGTIAAPVARRSSARDACCASRVVGTLLATGGLLVTMACADGGGMSPAAPSEYAGGAATPSETVVSEQARDGGRVEVDFVEQAGSAWSGSCTVMRSGTNGRAKAVGSGPPDADVVLWLYANGIGSMAGTSTNGQGTFRTAWLSRTMHEGQTLRCELRNAGDGLSLWASTGDFAAP